MKTNKLKVIPSILHEKCPHCLEGNVFEKKKHFFELPVMKDRCDKCGYYFDREPGYFLGAMYLSYGMAVFQGIIAFLICYFLFKGLDTLTIGFIVVGVIIGFGLKNYKLSRIIYMHIFPQ